jgi:RimJ/RimL family protein N-acetyltransferase
MLSLEGKFVRLLPLEPADAERLLAAATEDRSSYRFTIVPHDLDSMKLFIGAAIAERDRGASVPFATFDARTGKAVGSTRYMTIDRWGHPDEPAPSKDAAPSALEIGATWLSGSAQRSAINTEAKLLMLRYAFEIWKVERVTLKTDARNQRSRDAIARLGARLDGVLRAWQRAAEGGPRDTAVFSILRGEWSGIRAGLEERLKRG